MNDSFSQVAAQAAAWLRAAGGIAVMTGAGVSAESGVATFRGFGGLWEGQRPEDVATPEAFQRNPERVWRFYNARRTQLRQCRPNPAHLALVDLEQRCGAFTLITQNVDGLHRAAGSRNVIELHGDIWIDRCTDCGFEWRAERPSAEPLPHCAACNGRVRPGVVWFGEMLPPAAMQQAQGAACACDVMLVIGTSSLVHPAAGLAWAAKQHGARVVEINPEATPLTETADLVITEKAGTALPALVAALRSGDA